MLPLDWKFALIFQSTSLEHENKEKEAKVKSENEDD